MKKTALMSAGVAVAAALILASCSAPPTSKPSTSPEADQKYTIQLITLSNASPYWLAVKAGAEAAAAELGNIEVKFDAPAEDSDVADQLTIFNNAVTSRVDGILIAAGNPEALVEPIKRAQSAGIPVITVDQGVEPNVADSFVATDNIAASREIALHMAELMEGKGQYAIVNPSQAFTSGIQRPQGFQEGMAEFPGIEFVGMQQSESNIATAQSQAANFMQSNPDLRLIYAANDRSASGVGNAIRTAGKGGKVLGAGFDVNPDIIDFLKTGVFQASLLQSPFGEGEIAVQTIAKIFKGEKVDKVIPTPVFLLTDKNLDTDEAREAIRQYMPDYAG